ncbi:hypothetical protein EIN_375490 [Entamoeba invadens IP1]|uniref:Serine/threonine-protein phosphatase 4 regulatory subunit 3-like central domain-containing protein n=1 Tax=Entamoeba invadens IP1 TaxID=370355 RepID=A0A0A1TU61_ENTIV|nr:hypothetical protein EIN_375490 [Entamoeba invadens IP1]ELP83444.1 hypothetical protein EIN_375490 [Entamoeba invadens IP1]|eukprot:XP_004182790.1 hypothetical protein EIN_375490 [Entamoeba invadens IP1]
MSICIGNGAMRHQILSGAVLSSGIGCVVDGVFLEDQTGIYMLKQITLKNKKLEGVTLDLLCKVLTSLLIPIQSKEFEQVQTVEGFVDGLMEYIDNYSICDYIIALLKLDVFHQNSRSIQWFCEQSFITKLLNVFLETPVSIDRIESVARIINEIVIWRHSHQIGAAANVFVDFFNTDKSLDQFVTLVFSSEMKEIREFGLMVISDMLTCNTSRSDLCTIPVGGLPAIFKNLVSHFENMQLLLQTKNEGFVGQTKIRLGFIVLSLLLSNYSVIYTLVDEHGFLDSLLDIFYDTTHQCTIFRQIVYNIIDTVVQRPIGEMKYRLLKDNALLERMIDVDVEALKIHEKTNFYPDYFLINSMMMYNIYKNKEINTPKFSAKLDNQKFTSYVEDIIVARTEATSVHFGKKHSPDNYFDTNTYTNFLLNSQKRGDDDDLF